MDVRTGTRYAKVQEGDCLEDLGVDGRIILKWILREWGWMGVEWIHMTHDWHKQESVLKR